jgi:hypothetical protein
MRHPVFDDTATGWQCHWAKGVTGHPTITAGVIVKLSVSIGFSSLKQRLLNSFYPGADHASP